jgi:ABC-type Fe3+ transport system substrate-binding protein
MLLAACSSSGDSTPQGRPATEAEWQAGAPAEWQDVLAKARQEGEVVVGGPAFLGEAMTKAFQRDTGIKLEWVGASGAELSARLQQEEAAGRSTMDLKFGGAQELFVDWRKILKPLKDQLLLPGATDPSKWRTKAVDWYDPAKAYMLKGSRWVFGWPVVNADIIDPAAIRTWADLLKPEYRGKIGSYDITTPSPGQGVAHFLYNTKGERYLRDLYLGQQVKFTADLDQVVEWAARGTYPIVLGAVQSSLERFRKEGINLVPLLPSDQPGYLTSGFSVLVEAAHAPHPSAAQVFINWYASRPGSAVYSEGMLEASGRADVDLASVPSYVKPREGVSYWEDSDLDWYLNRRQKVNDMLVAMVRGR